MLTFSQYLSASSGSNGSIPIVVYRNITFNWKTGWLQNFLVTQTSSNGSTYLEVAFQRHSLNNVLSTLYIYASSLLEVGSLFVVVMAVVIVVISYNSYAKMSKDSDHSQSFSQYLQNRFHYIKKRQKALDSSETDKALRFIESILEETKDNAQ